MPEIRTPLWKTLTRLAILVGGLTVLIALAVHNIVDSVKFLSAAFLIPFIIGAVLFLGGVAINARWLWQAVTGRKFLIGLNVWAMVFLSFVLVLVANGIVAGTPQTDGWALDLTKSKLHSLSEQTRNVLKGLKQDVKITVLMGTGMVSVGWSGRIDVGSQVKDLVRLYRAQSRRIQVDILDAYREKTRIEQVALETKSQVEPDTILVRCGESKVQVPFNDLVDLPPMGPFMQTDPRMVGFKGEEKLTSAIIRVTESKQATVYFLTGHGELAPDGPEGKALNQFATELKRDNYKVESLNLMTQREVPADCDILVIAGPTAPLDQSEVELIRKYLEKNGKLLVFVRPRAARGNLEGLDKLLADYNVQVRDDAVVIEVYRDLFSGQSIGDVQVVVQDYGRHPIADELKTVNCMLQSVSPVKALSPEDAGGYGRAPQLAAPYRATTLMQSSDRSWAETNLAARQVKFDSGQDEKGPLSLAVAVERRPPPTSPYGPPPPEEETEGPRLVVVGSVSVAADSSLAQYAGNRAFVMNCVNWLAKKESKLGIPPQRPDHREWNASPAARKGVLLVTVVLMPLAAIMTGGFVWWYRRR